MLNSEAGPGQFERERRGSHETDQVSLYLGSLTDTEND